ncbi:hypothetical protein RAS1_43420 [Phycisphaerae bacterium RAS1]|nr:hypothetical protein RAS1_43420 [Phycisphaerae bacterium RAS1]
MSHPIQLLVLALAGFNLAMVDDEPPTKPAVLVAAESSAAFAKGVVVYRRQSTEGRASTVRITTKFTANEVLQYHDYIDTSAILPDDQLTRYRRLWTKDWMYTNTNTAIASQAYDKAPYQPMPFRSLGVELPLAETTFVRRYDVSDDDTLKVVTCRESDSRGRSIERKLWIAPSRGFNVVRAELWVDGELRLKKVTTLAQWGQHWFPETVLEFRAGRPEPSSVTTIEQAEFDSPTIPDALLPADVGIEVGTTVICKKPGTEGQHRWVWDGAGLDTFQAVGGKLKRGELTMGPNLKAELDRRRQTTAALRRAGLGDSIEGVGDAPKLSEWEEFVRRFVLENALSTDQEQRAWIIYRDCRERVEDYLRTARPRFEDLGRSQVRINSGNATDDEIVEAARLRQRLMGPVDELFTKQLVPRLGGLLTPAQKREKKETK